jgi:sugar lactone lactonase YvrE
MSLESRILRRPDSKWVPRKAPAGPTLTVSIALRCARHFCQPGIICLVALLTYLTFSANLAAAQSNSAVAYTFTTFAGKAASGSADGAGDTAQFSLPWSIAVDSAGNLYVADRDNHTIRKITSAGVVSTLAGSAGTPGSADGVGSNARFNHPSGIAVDSAGNLYVADTDNHTIRKLVPVGTNWTVSTLAGSVGSSGSANGTANNALFYQPHGIAVDSVGNLYVADTLNSTIRKLVPSGADWVVSTLAGLAGFDDSVDGEGSNARFFDPYGIAVDSTGNLYVADTENSTIRKLAPVGTNWVVSTLAGLAGFDDSVDGEGSKARFYTPFGIAVDSAGYIFVADTLNFTIRKITPLGVVSTFAGSVDAVDSAEGTGTNAGFHAPFGITVDNVGNLYVTDLFNQTIRKITAAGVVSSLGGPARRSGSTDGTGGNARFNQPNGVAGDNGGQLYVADTFNHTIRKITSAGVVSTLAGLAESSGSADGTGNNARFNQPNGIAVDSAGQLYVADTYNHTIRKITSAGVVSTLAGLAESPGSADGAGSSAQFNYPGSIAVDSANSLYVADTVNHTIRKITPTSTNWVVSTVAGLAGIPGSADGTGTNAMFRFPHGIIVDSVRNLFVAEGNHTIRKITSGGGVSTLAGLAGSSGSTDGTATNARFNNPNGITLDSAGNLYVTDSENYTIRKITSAGVVSTLAGLAESFGSANGIGNMARFDTPKGIAVDRMGQLYVADTFNHTIRKGVFTGYAPINAVPYTAPPMSGQLVVTLQPPEANGQWRFPWELGWHNSGATASNLVTGNYPIEFRSVPSYLSLPVQPVQVVAGNTTAITNEYLPTISARDASSSPGSLTVFLGPTPPAGAGWRFLGDNTPFFQNAFTTNLPPGTYLIEFATLSPRITPPSQAVQVSADLPSFLSVNYLLAATPPANVYLPFPVPANQVNDESTYPFGFNGQLQSDTGYGSGVAVQPNVVLTAAHLVFNDQTLSYVSRAHWFFRRDAGVSEPLPLEARGFYLLRGYAAQRTNDLASGYSPDQSTPPSRNTDVAALYFQLPVAGGGHGGYLPSDALPNTWLSSTALKMLVGYPVDGSQLGDGTIVPGKMYQTNPQPYPLSLSPDPTPEQQQIYLAPWLLSYPGNSGGPLYVQLNDFYYPAGVYLGTLFSGSTPYASVVRAIDSNVVNLIVQAQAMGDSGTNSTGGGVITIIPSQAINASSPGYVQWQLGPAAAVQAGAGWRLQGDSSYSTATNYTRAVFSADAIAVEFKELPGWNLPRNDTVRVFPKILETYNAFYTVTNPVLVANPALGIGISGTLGTVYRLESRSSLSSGGWLPVNTNLIISTGFNWILSNPSPTTFYRAVWLP